MIEIHPGNQELRAAASDVQMDPQALDHQQTEESGTILARASLREHTALAWSANMQCT